jgi:hypothetical protein
MLRGGWRSIGRSVENKYLVVVSSPRVRSHLSEGMRIATLYHTKMVEEHAAL